MPKSDRHVQDKKYAEVQYLHMQNFNTCGTWKEFPFVSTTEQTLQVCYSTRGTANFKIACLMTVSVF